MPFSLALAGGAVARSIGRGRPPLLPPPVEGAEGAEGPMGAEDGA